MTILRITTAAAALMMLAACNQNEGTETEELPTNAGATTPAALPTEATASEPSEMLSDVSTPMTGQTPNPVPEGVETNEPASEPAGGVLTPESQTSEALVERAGER